MRAGLCFSLVLVSLSAHATDVKVAVLPRSTMATSQLLKGFSVSCPNVSIILDESRADYLVEAQGPKDTEWLKHYRITLFDQQGRAVFSADKHYPGASAKEVCKFLNAKR
jgi:hypothetical protein